MPLGNITSLSLGSWGTDESAHGRDTEGWAAGRVPFHGLPDPFSLGGQCADRACCLLRPTAGRCHWLNGNWRRGRLQEGQLQLMLLSEEPTSIIPTAEVEPWQVLLGPSLFSFQYGWLSLFTSHHFIHFIIFLVSFIFSSFFILSSLPF